MPVYRKCDQDGRGEYYQYGKAGTKYYIRELGDEEARYKAYSQETAGYTEKIQSSFLPVKADSEYDAEQLAKGSEVEMEHTTNPEVAKIITKHHLNEFSNYYIALEKMEDRLKKEKNRRRKRTHIKKINRIQSGFHQQYGKYYRWGAFGIPYYVKVYGERQARQKAFNDGALERLTGGYK